MQSKAANVSDYFSDLPHERMEAMIRLREVILENLPEGFAEVMGYGMPGFVVPHSRYPDGYHCNPEQPLPFISFASQKNHIALYHMGIYADPEILDWFVHEYPKHAKRKLDMGKSCIRFKRMDDIPYDLIGQLAGKITVDDWIRRYEENLSEARAK